MERRLFPYGIPVAAGLALLAGMLGWGHAARQQRSLPAKADVFVADRAPVARPGGQTAGSGTGTAAMLPASAAAKPPAHPAATKPAATKPAAAQSDNKPAQVLAGNAALTHGEPFIWPVVAPVSSYFGPRWGRFHGGIDIAANMGEPIKAARSGTVFLAGPLDEYGDTVILQHPDGTRTLYAHCSQYKVKNGDRVSQGQVIALVGTTGLSTGPHLHFEVRVNDQTRDPLLYLPPNQYAHR